MTKCRFCKSDLNTVFADLGMQPPSNAYVKNSNSNKSEIFFPLVAYVCEKCFLTQLDEYQSHDEIFNAEYAYFSSYSSTWMAHCKNYVEKITEKLALNKNSFVVEIASNDGYLLRNFKEKAIPHLGIEPTLSTAKVAIENGIDTVVEFFGVKLASRLAAELKQKPDLIIGNNVLAHVPDINDFVAGLKILLAENGTLNFEFPHLLNLIKHNQFDTIYHEHFSYLSLFSVEKIFANHGLMVYDVEEISTHGGSLRIYACHDKQKEKQKAVDELLKKELNFGIADLQTYKKFQENIKKTKRVLLEKFIEIKNSGKSIAAYGAAAKGNTFLNYCGIKSDFVDFVVDKNPHKQGHLMPGNRIPIVAESMILESKPDYIFILPWNLKDEIISQLAYTKDWGCKFIVAIPSCEVI